MKVLLVNGSPNEKGCTYTALSVIAKELENHGVDTEIFQAGKTTKGCMGCKYCAKNGKCITDDCVNEALSKLEDFDGFVFGSPVHYASPSGAIATFLDRLFYAGSSKLSHKPCAAVASCRRAGSSATLDQLLKYPLINQMPVVSSQYWTMVHGTNPQEVLKDEEGIQTMRTLAKNMAWMLKCIEAGKNSGVDAPDTEVKIRTNFIR